MTTEQHTDNRMRILVIGPYPPPLGGTTANMRILTEFLMDRDDVELLIVNTSKKGKGPGSAIACIFRTLRDTFRLMWKADVITLHVNEPQKGLPIWMLARLTRKPFIVRWFGGADYRKYGNALRKWSAKWMFRHSDMNLFQTKALVRMSLEDGSKKSLWYSNSRNLGDAKATCKRSDHCRKFVFVGHVHPYKGIGELIQAAEQLPEDAAVDVYGPFTGDLSEQTFRGSRRVRYCGIIPSDKVISKLAEYDALLLPTYHPGEGYPGVVIEAYFAGLPVICTRWQALPEIVDQTSGILVPPHDAGALRDAMLSMISDGTTYRQLCEGAWKKRIMFSGKQWAETFVRFCYELGEGE